MDTIYMITKTWKPQRRMVFGKRTWTYQRVFYTTDRDKARDMLREIKAERGDAKVDARQQTHTAGLPLEEWCKRKFRGTKTVNGWS